MAETVVENTPINTKKIRERTGKVVEAIQETSDTWTLHIEAAKEDLNYLAGQFISIDPHQFQELSEVVAYLEHVKGKKELVRAYSLASAPHESVLAITTKPERFYPDDMLYPPLLSPLLASDILKGRPIKFLGFSGAYVLPADHGERTDEVLHFVAGSGAVPNFSLLKDELSQNKNPNVFHTLIDVNKTQKDIIYKKELDELQQKYPKRLRILHFLTREENADKLGTDYFAPRPTLEQVRGLIKDPEKVLVYTCGSAITKWQKRKAKETGVPAKPRFLEGVEEMMKTLGIDRKRFKKEAY